MRWVFIGRIPKDLSNSEYSTIQDDIEKEFSRFGKILSSFIARYPPGFAFVEFEDALSAEKAVRRLGGATGGFRGYIVELSTKNTPRGRRGREGGEDCSDRDRPRSPSPYDRKRMRKMYSKNNKK